MNESEDPRKCAIREVLEETGYNFGTSRPNGREHKLQVLFVNYYPYWFT